MISFIRRSTAILAVMLVATGSVASLSVLAQDNAAKAPPTPAPSATPAAPSAAPATVTPTVTRESIENPYGFEAMWRQGDYVTKGTLIILVIMSMGSWYIIFVKLWEQFKMIREGHAMRTSFWKAPSLKDGANRLKASSAYRYIALSGLDANEHHEGSLTENIDLNTWVTMSVQRSVEGVQSRLQEGLAFLATVGSTAPFVGLFGTVWGIYHALTAIGIAGQASIDKVAGPVGEALIMTAIGLAVAVPAVLGYNWLVRRNKVVMESVRGFGADLHAVLLGRRVETKAVPAR